MASTSTSARFDLVLLLVALISGIAALVYEIVFFRYLGLAFGVAIQAVAAVVAAFLAGLGLGAYLGGRLLSRKNALATYAILELLIGLIGFSLPSILTWVNTWVVPSPGNDAFPAASLGLTFVLLLPSTTLMGATFPVLGRAIASGRSNVATRVGLLYGINTAGAVIGVIIAAFFLLPEFGLAKTTWAAACLNLVLAATCMRLSHRTDVTPTTPDRGQKKNPSPDPTSPSMAPLFLCVTLVGFVSTAIQVVATRLLISLLGASVQAFAAVLAVFLFGIASGGVTLPRLVEKSKKPRALLGTACILLAGALGLGLYLLRLNLDGADPLVGAINLGAPEGGMSLTNIAWRAILLSTLLLLPATVISGAILPAASRFLHSDSRQLSRGLGTLYGMNTLGAIVGSLAAAFLFLPTLGLRDSFLLLAGVGVLAGLTVMPWQDRPRLPRTPFLATVIVVAITGLYFGLHHEEKAEALNADEMRTLLHLESSAAAVKVAEVDEFGELLPVRCLFVNGKAVATSLFMDRRLQLILGALPSLIHEDPQNILSIALGTGMSSGALAASGAKTDIVELNSGVVEACTFFDPWTGKVLEQDNVTVFFDDGRAFLRREDRQYDVISADPIHPWVAGSAYLYTEEYYRLARTRLKQNGIMAQWIPLYQLSTEDIAGIVRTFHRVFPEISAWVTGYDLVLLGSEQPLSLDPALISERLKKSQLAALMEDTGVRDVADILGTRFAGLETLEELAAKGPEIITDDHPWIEFTAPRSVFAAGYANEVIQLLADAEDPVPLSGEHQEEMKLLIERRQQFLKEAARTFVKDIEITGKYGEPRARYSETLRLGTPR